MNAEEIEEHGLVLAIQAAHMHSINCKDATAATATVSLDIILYLMKFY